MGLKKKSREMDKERGALYKQLRAQEEAIDELRNSIQQMEETQHGSGNSETIRRLQKEVETLKRAIQISEAARSELMEECRKGPRQLLHASPIQ